jgi:hypothetical protein
VNELLDAALNYAARGWHVFPLLPNSKRPACPRHPAARCDRSDPYCRHGHVGWEQRATTSIRRIRRAWTSHPYGIAIATGPSGLLVVDTDRPKPAEPGALSPNVPTGDDHLRRLAEQQGGSLPRTWTVATPSGGTHRYFLIPRGEPMGNTAGRLGALVDTRGQGGYVVAPPTNLYRPYTLQDDRVPVPLPDWLAQLLAKPAPQLASSAMPQLRQHPPGRGAAVGYAEAAIAGEVTHVEAARPGQRNHTLFCAAVALGQLVSGGQLEERAAREALRAAATQHIHDGAFSAGQADATITSGLSRGARTPRTGPSKRTAA